jgi:hypothetical protein
MNDQVFELIITRLDKLESKIDSLLEWKWKMAGIAIVFSTIAGILVQFVLIKVGN